jgi:hypothetical protein
MCFCFLYSFETFLILGRTERYMIKSVCWCSVKCPLFFSDFNEIWIFSTDFRKIFKYKISWKSVQWERSFSMRTDGRTDGWTDMTKLIVAFRNFANVLENKWQLGAVTPYNTNRKKQHCLTTTVWWFCNPPPTGSQLCVNGGLLIKFVLAQMIKSSIGLMSAKQSPKARTQVQLAAEPSHILHFIPTDLPHTQSGVFIPRETNLILTLSIHCQYTRRAAYRRL